MPLNPARYSHWLAEDGKVGVMWEYAEASRLMTLASVAASDCIYCDSEMMRFPSRKKDRVYSVDPKIFEDIVGSVFKDHGYTVRITAFSGDDGIDVILDDSSGKTIGVQVKRYKKELRIEAEQIRSLAGALVLGGHTKGIFVTTSSFRSGAKKTAERYGKIGHPIELMDAERFLDALGIAQLKSLELTDEQINSWVLTPGAHIGTGAARAFEPGEDLRQRPVIVMAYTREEIIELER